MYNSNSTKPIRMRRCDLYKQAAQSRISRNLRYQRLVLRFGSIHVFYMSTLSGFNGLDTLCVVVDWSFFSQTHM